MYRFKEHGKHKGWFRLESDIHHPKEYIWIPPILRGNIQPTERDHRIFNGYPPATIAMSDFKMGKRWVEGMSADSFLHSDPKGNSTNRRDGVDDNRAVNNEAEI